MTPPLLGLSAYAAASALFGPRLLRACGRRHHGAPRLYLVLCVVLPSSWAIAVLSVGLAAIAQFSDGLGLAALLHACLRAVRVLLGVHGPADVPAAVALVGSLVFMLRWSAVAVRQAHHDRRQRRSHQRTVCDPAGTTRLRGQRISVVTSPALTAYCVPGRDAAIVLTTAVLRGLPPRELDAVVAHEQAHLRGRHHLCVAWTSVLARAFPFVPLLRAAARDTARVVEWLADDHAGRRCGRRPVARALAAMATNSTAPVAAPEAALTATGSDVLDRVRRLLDPRVENTPARGPITVALALPLLVLAVATAVLIPAATADHTPLCQSAITTTEHR